MVFLAQMIFFNFMPVSRTSRVWWHSIWSISVWKKLCNAQDSQNFSFAFIFSIAFFYLKLAIFRCYLSKSSMLARFHEYVQYVNDFFVCCKHSLLYMLYICLSFCVVLARVQQLNWLRWFDTIPYFCTMLSQNYEICWNGTMLCWNSPPSSKNFISCSKLARNGCRDGHLQFGHHAVPSGCTGHHLNPSQTEKEKLKEQWFYNLLALFCHV